MFRGEEDGALLRAMRMQATYNGYKNSLIEWTLSEAWNNPGKEPWNYSKACISIRFSHDCASLAYVDTTNMVHVPVVVGLFEVRNLDKEMRNG